jgi:hypothetical protein
MVTLRVRRSYVLPSIAQRLDLCTHESDLSVVGPAAVKLTVFRALAWEIKHAEVTA